MLPRFRVRSQHEQELWGSLQETDFFVRYRVEPADFGNLDGLNRPMASAVTTNRRAPHRYRRSTKPASLSGRNCGRSDSRRSVVSQISRAELPLEHLTVDEFDTVRRRTPSRADRLDEIDAAKVQRDTVVRGVTGAERAVTDQTMIGRAPFGLAVVVRAGAGINQAEPIIERIERTEGIRDAAAEPAQHSRADATQHGTAHPGVPEHAIEPMRTPQREQIGRATAADIDDVLLGDEACKLVRRRRPPPAAVEATGRRTASGRSPRCAPRKLGRS